MADKSFVFRFANVEAHEREFSLVIAGQLVSIEPKAFRVLLILLRKPKKLIPKEELLNAVWGDAAVTENSLTRAIALLRRVLGDDARDPKFIETVATVGYRWITPVDAEEVTTSALISPDNPAEETPLPTAIPDAIRQIQTPSATSGIVADQYFTKSKAPGGRNSSAGAFHPRVFLGLVLSNQAMSSS